MFVELAVMGEDEASGGCDARRSARDEICLDLGTARRASGGAKVEFREVALKISVDSCLGTSAPITHLSSSLSLSTSTGFPA